MGILLAAGRLSAQEAEQPASPIRFTHRLLPFVLDNAETPRKHAPETMAGGVAAFDFDNDGHVDIYLVNGADIKTLKKTGPQFWNRLYKNDGKGNFEDVTEKAGVAGTGYDTGVAIGDYDGDGFQDIFIGGVHRNTLYRNNGDGTFTDVTEKTGLAKPDKEFGPLWSVGGAWLDFDNDGKLDLFVANYMGWDAATEPLCQFEGIPEYCHPRLYKELPNQLFRNRGDGTFEDVSEAAGIRAHPGKGMGAAIADFDNDGWMEIFIANDKLFNFFFRNLKNGKFEEIAFEAGVALPEHGNFISGMGVDFRDIDNDGFPDVVFVALDNETFPLYKNTGKGGFREITSTSDLTRQSRSMAGYSPGIYDLDNDGWKDIFVSRGHVQSPQMAGRVQIDQHNSIFRNLGNGKFLAKTEEAGFNKGPAARHRGSATADFNGDGRLDIVVSALKEKAQIWFNESPGNHHWLAFQLQGVKSNRDGVGAAIKVVTKKGAQYNHVSSASGYASSSAGPVHFGLGTEPSAELVEIRWPSGIVQQLKNVKGNQVLKVKEPEK